MRRFSLAVLGLLLASTAQAGIISSQALVDIFGPTANTGDINTATDFMLGDLVTTTANTGGFTGLPTQDFGAVDFNLSTGISFGSAAFGEFTSTSVMLASNIPGAVSFYVTGDWTPGTYGGFEPGVHPGELTISLNQTPAGFGGSIAANATFADPPGAVPEASTWAMMAIGFAGLGFVGWRSSRTSFAFGRRQKEVG